jgi:hypothetical protein
MKKLAVAVLVMSLGVVAFSAPALGRPEHGRNFYFDGTTQAGQEVFFIIQNNGSEKDFLPFFATSLVNCPDGSSFTYEWFFINYIIPLDGNNHFEVGIESNQIPFDWQGTLSGKNATGTINQGYAAYDLSGNVEDCGTGDVGWQATGVGSARTAGAADFTVTVQKDANGKIHETITRN